MEKTYYVIDEINKRQDAKDYVSAESISLYRIAKATGLSWATVKNYLQKDKPYSSETGDKILIFLNALSYENRTKSKNR